MRVYNRAYEDRDFGPMWQFLVQDYADRKEKYIWAMARLGEWAYGIWSERKFFPSFKRKNAQLWFNNLDQLIGFVISENCDHNVFLLAKRGYEFIYDEMIRWFTTNWQDRGTLTVETNEYAAELIAALGAASFERLDRVIAIDRQFDVQAVAKQEIHLDPEFAIVDMLISPEYEAKVVMGNNAWNDGRGGPVTNLLRLMCEYDRENPSYNPKFDLSVVHRSGIHVASCAAFVDYDNNVAWIEKVCTHTDYRRRGLAQAVIRECFKRLAIEGIEYGYIQGYSEGAKNLYSQFGAIASVNWYRFTQTVKDNA